MSDIITVTLNPCIDKTIILKSFRVGLVNRADGTRNDAGGKGINVSRVLTNFKTENTAMGIVGADNSVILKDMLDKEGILYDFCETPGMVRTNYKIYDSKNEQTTDVNEKGMTVDKTALDSFIKKYTGYAKKAKYIVLAGSLAPNINDSVYADLISIANECGAKAILDTSGEMLKKGISAKPYVIKPNIHEFEDLCGKTMKSDSDIFKSVMDIHRSGVSHIVVTMGEKGAIYMNGSVAYKTNVPRLHVKSTVGCGDSTVAGMVYSMINGFDAKKTALFSTACGCVTATKEGTRMCELDEVQRILGNITADRIEYL